MKVKLKTEGSAHLDAVGVAFQQVFEQLLGLVEVAQIVLRRRSGISYPLAAGKLRRQALHHMRMHSTVGDPSMGGQSFIFCSFEVSINCI